MTLAEACHKLGFKTVASMPLAMGDEAVLRVMIQKMRNRLAKLRAGMNYNEHCGIILNDDLHSNIADSSLSIISEAGHEVNKEQSDELSRILADFLQ